MPGRDLVDRDLEEGLNGRAAEVERGLGEVGIHLRELRHDVQDDIGQVERDVRDEQRPEAEHRVDAQGRADEGKQQRQRDARDDLRVGHGDVRHGHDGRAQLAAHPVDAHGGGRTEQRRQQAREHRDDHGVQQQPQQVPVAEQLFILIEREALEHRNVHALVEGRDGQHDHRDIKKDEDQNGDDTIDFSHSVTMLSSASSSVKRFIMPTQTKTRTIRTRDMAAPRFGL